MSSFSITNGQVPKVKNDPNHDDRPIHFGFSLGLNFMDYRIEHSQFANDNNIYVGIQALSPGINIHAIGNLRLSDRWDLRLLPGISFGERLMIYQGINPEESTNPDTLGQLSYSYKANSSYIEIPLTLKYKSLRLNNFRPYLLAGGNVRWDLAGKKDFDFTKQLFMTNSFDVFGEFGVGMDFYMVYFKLGMELKYSFGLRNILKRPGDIPPEYAPYTDAMKSLHSHMVILLFNFE